MQRVPREQQPRGKPGRPSRVDEFEIAALVGSVNFVADNWQTGVREVDADLMRAPRLWKSAHETESRAVAIRETLV